MKVLLVGATGFLGAAILAALQKQRHQVTATWHRGPFAAVVAIFWLMITKP